MQLIFIVFIKYNQYNLVEMTLLLYKMLYLELLKLLKLLILVNIIIKDMAFALMKEVLLVIQWLKMVFLMLQMHEMY